MSKKIILTAVALVVCSLMSSAGFAKSKRLSTKQKKQTASYKVAEGFSISLVKDFMKVDNKVTIGGRSAENKNNNSDQEVGIGLGYTNINIQNLGWSGRFVFNSYDDDTLAYRADINGTFGFNKNFYGFAGLNVNKFDFGTVNNGQGTSLTIDGDIDFGLQAGLGAQFTENFGAALSYGFIRAGGDILINGQNVGTIEADIAGLEFSLIGTF